MKEKFYRQVKINGKCYKVATLGEKITFEDYNLVIYYMTKPHKDMIEATTGLSICRHKIHSKKEGNEELTRNFNAILNALYHARKGDYKLLRKLDELDEFIEGERDE